MAKKRKKSVLSKLLRFFSEAPGRAYLVGGMVRDLLLGIEPVDIDVVVEDDILPIAERLSRVLKGRCRIHAEFGTATILASGEQIDLARARTETYPRPAHLPAVRFARLSDDFARRDFTVNAVALSLAEKDFGRIIDPFSGVQDIRDGTIRVLHRRSFIDDPTRIFRAVRYRRRLGFRIDPETGRLMKEAVRADMIGRLSAQRTANELKLILSEREWRPILNDLSQLRVLRLDRGDLDLMDRLGDLKIHYLIGRIGIRGLSLNRKEAKLAGELAELPDIARRLKKISSNHRLWLCLSPLEPGTVTALAAADPKTRERTRRFLRLKKIKPAVTGRDLTRLGLKPGPLYREILQRFFYMQLDGKLRQKGPALKKLIK